MGLEFLKRNPTITRGNAGIVSIPRGGVPTATGLNQACNELGLPSAQHCSQIKTAPDSLFQPDMFSHISTLIIADGVIGTGKTICNHLAQVPAEWKGRVAVFSNAASKLGLKAIRKFAVNHVAQPVVGVAGHVFQDDECEWVDCDGKEVYFIGYNKSRGLDFQLPDFGDHISVVQVC